MRVPIVRILFLLCGLWNVRAQTPQLDAYERVGNGWCLDQRGRRLKLGPEAWRHAEDVSWKRAAVDATGRSRQCERDCSRHYDCIGYMTEDGAQCTIIRRADHHASDGIFGSDEERRNFCFARATEEAYEESTCEASASWPDGRVEKRRCQVIL